LKENAKLDWQGCPDASPVPAGNRLTAKENANLGQALHPCCPTRNVADHEPQNNNDLKNNFKLLIEGQIVIVRDLNQKSTQILLHISCVHITTYYVLYEKAFKILMRF
jgi:hypothetical protein